MADENARNRNQETDQEKGKAMGAGASGSYQGQQGQTGDQFGGRGSQPNEVSGQGGGVQGTGQSQSNPGGYTEGQDDRRDQSRHGNQGSTNDDRDR